MEERRTEERRSTIDREELKALLGEVIDEKHNGCVFYNKFNTDDTHDLRVLLDMYRDTTSTMRKWFIRGLLIVVFGAVIFFAAFKNGFLKG